MKRRTLRKQWVRRSASCGVLLLFLFAAQQTLAQAVKKNTAPNIIFILADDLGYGDLGCYGQKLIHTPHIDALAQSGIRFTQFYSGSTVCAPARSSFMTGMHTGHTPIRGNKSFEPEGQSPLPDSSATIAMELKKAGYQTAAIGKWSLGFITTSGAPHKKGFDYFYGYNCQSLAHNYYPDHLWENEKRIDLPENLSQPALYSADLFQQKALEYISSRNSNQPFFLYLPYTLPHADLTPPHDSTYEYYKQRLNEMPLKQSDKKNLNKQYVELYPHAAFAAMVARLDRYVGEIVAEVKRKGIAQNTMIVFVSDNGPHKEKGGDPEFFRSHGIYRGIKRDLYEGGIRVPLIIAWEGSINAGRETAHPTALWDFFPSFQQASGGKTSANIDGISMLPLLLNKPQPKHDYLYWEFHEEGGKQALLWKQWKLIKLNVSTGKDVAVELYNLAKDPSETKNVAAANGPLVQKMEKMIQQAHYENKDWKFYQ
jgi:arylsulfatase A